MYLNNSLIKKGIRNGTVGMITDFNKKKTLSIKVAFCIQSGIVYLVLLHSRTEGLTHTISPTKFVCSYNTQDTGAYTTNK